MKDKYEIQQQTKFNNKRNSTTNEIQQQTKNQKENVSSSNNSSDKMFINE
jgi:hypothetical protein